MNTVKNYITIHFAVKLDRCDGSCNTLNDLSNKIYVPNKTEGLNLSVFNLIMGINWSITLKKHVSPRCKYKFIIDNSVIMCDEVIDAEKAKTIPKNIIRETKSFHKVFH